MGVGSSKCPPPPSSVTTPSCFLCPLSKELMKDPVIALGDGMTYERSALVAWFDSGKGTSPETAAEMGTKVMIANVALRKAIREYFEMHPQPDDPDKMDCSTDDSSVVFLHGQGGEDHVNCLGNHSQPVLTAFICPISCEVMHDPVVLIADGHSYERQSIEKWVVGLGHHSSPATGLRVATPVLLPNVALRKAIEHIGPVSQSAEEGPAVDGRHPGLLSRTAWLSVIGDVLLSFNPVSDEEEDDDCDDEPAWDSRHPVVSTLAAWGMVAPSPSSPVPDMSTQVLETFRLLLPFKDSPASSVTAGCRSIARLFERCCQTQEGDGSCKDVGRSGLQLVVEAMRAYPEDVALQSYALEAMAEAGCENHYGNALSLAREHGGVELVMAALQRFSSNVLVQRIGLAVIGTWVLPDEEAGPAFKKSNAYDVILSALKGFPEDFRTQVQGFAAITNLSVQSDSLTQHWPAILKAIRISMFQTFPEDRNIAATGYMALRNLVVDGYQQEGPNPVGEACLGDEELMDKLVRDLDKWCTDETVQMVGFNFVCGLVRLDPARGVRFYDVAVKALGDCLDGKRTKSACTVLLEVIRLLMGTPSASLRVVKGSEDLARLAVKASKEESGNERCVNTAFMLLGRLAYLSREGKEAVGQVGGCEAAVQAMADHLKVEDLAWSTCLCIMNATNGHHANQRRCLDAGVLPVLRDAVKHWKDDSEMQRVLWDALGNLCWVIDGPVEVVEELVELADQAASRRDYADDARDSARTTAVYLRSCLCYEEEEEGSLCHDDYYDEEEEDGSSAADYDGDHEDNDDEEDEEEEAMDQD